MKSFAREASSNTLSVTLFWLILLLGVHSLSKLSTMIAPIEAGMVITIRRLNATSVSVSIGNLFNEISTSATIIAVIA